MFLLQPRRQKHRLFSDIGLPHMKQAALKTMRISLNAMRHDIQDPEQPASINILFWRNLENMLVQNPAWAIPQSRTKRNARYPRPSKQQISWFDDPIHI